MRFTSTSPSAHSKLRISLGLKPLNIDEESGTSVNRLTVVRILIGCCSGLATADSTVRVDTVVEPIVPFQKQREQEVCQYTLSDKRFIALIFQHFLAAD